MKKEKEFPGEWVLIISGKNKFHSINFATHKLGVIACETLVKHLKEEMKIMLVRNK